MTSVNVCVKPLVTLVTYTLTFMDVKVQHAINHHMVM